MPVDSLVCYETAWHALGHEVIVGHVTSGDRGEWGACPPPGTRPRALMSSSSGSSISGIRLACWALARPSWRTRLSQSQSLRRRHLRPTCSPRLSLTIIGFIIIDRMHASSMALALARLVPSPYAHYKKHTSSSFVPRVLVCLNHHV